MKKFLRKYNGWLGFVLGSVLFFVAPHFYRLMDPTAGQLDAGYIHPIIYAVVVVSIGSAIAWLLTQLTAPGPHQALDRLLEDDEPATSDPYTALFIFFAMFFSFITVVIAMV